MDILIDETDRNIRIPKVTTSKRGAIFLWLEQNEYYFLPDMNIKYTFLLESEIKFSKQIFNNYITQVLSEAGFRNFLIDSNTQNAGRTVNFNIQDLQRL
jgi:hypothetical protein